MRKFLLVLAVLFTLANAGATVYAGVAAEPLHTLAHVILTLLGAFMIWKLLPRAAGEDAEDFRTG